MDNPATRQDVSDLRKTVEAGAAEMRQASTQQANRWEDRFKQHEYENNRSFEEIKSNHTALSSTLNTLVWILKWVGAPSIGILVTYACTHWK